MYIRCVAKTYFNKIELDGSHNTMTFLITKYLSLLQTIYVKDGIQI